MSSAPPLRFLGAVVGGWVCVRAAILVPDWAAGVEERPRWPGLERIAVPSDVAPMIRPEPPPVRSAPMAARSKLAVAIPQVSRLGSAPTSLALARLHEGGRMSQSEGAAPAVRSVPLDVFVPGRSAPLRALAEASRWSGSAWAFVRRGSEPVLGAGSMLGGSQIGGRIGYRINGNVERPLSIVGRAYSPLGRRAGSEAALGLEWKPVAELPVRVLAERRGAIGSEGRSAFALMAYGGIGEVALPGGVRLEAYAQAGVVGARRRDLFADASVALALPLDEERGLAIGGALWGAAQPGVSRVDAGPRLSLKLPGAERARITADWRFRLQGDASPASGPSLTLVTEF